MSRQSLKTVDRLRRLREMHSAGASTRQIAAALGVKSHRTIGAWLAAAGLEPNGSASRAPRPAAPPPPVATAPSPPSPPSPTADAALLADGDADLDLDAPGAIAIVRRRLATVRAILDDLGPLVTSGGYPPAAFATLVNLEATLAGRIVEMTPPAPPDPERDPVSLDAAAKVRARLARLVGAVEERERAESRCARCGGPLPAAADPSPVTPGPEKRHVI